MTHAYTKTRFKVLAMFLTLVAASIVSSCSSEDYGDKKPDQFALRGDQPTWENGISELVKHKCANCHTQDRSMFVPANTPHSLDQIASQTFYQDKNNLGLIHAMRSRIDESSDRQMPPKFATPLSPTERQALSDYLKTIEDQLKLAESDAEGCAAVTVAPEEIEMILAKTCARCHTSPPKKPGRPPLAHYDEWLTMRDRAREAIRAGWMPPSKPGRPDFRTTPEAKKLLGVAETCKL